MVWAYQQSTGKMSHNGQLVEIGYAGSPEHKNNPKSQHLRNNGPLPRGTYRILSRNSKKGKHTLVLQQVSGESFGRSGFLIHAERVQPPYGMASEGCIILGRDIRRDIWESNDHLLEVIE